MVSLTHEALVQLFRNRPQLAPELLRDVFRQELPTGDRARVTEAQLNAVTPTEYSADLVIRIESERSDAPVGAVVLEVQLSPDSDKQWTWPVYVTEARARLGCDVRSGTGPRRSTREALS